ncbi:FG-GAP repeat domain-containing protein [Rhodopirellula sp. JC639]|uniref:FG-GAP repeat domain-containing protein n=1 Tax=Stieleria mannarensis TaxID=2755585 RepID=UPI001601F72A|nr:VCBS repeat-containing protein [Rhodopirellula sp. JC639]
MKQLLTVWISSVLLAGIACCKEPSSPSSDATGEVFRFKRLVLSDLYYCDGVSSGDIDGDGDADVVAGPYWYEGPDFQVAHAFYQPVALPPAESPSNSMFSFVADFSGDGRPDILVLGRVHKHQAIWYENPGETEGLWKGHVAFHRVKGESPTLVDLDGDGVPQVICHWDGRWGSIQPDPSQPRQPWRFIPIGAAEDWPQFYHGQGVGDVNRDGKPDLILNDGWYEQPQSAAAGADWVFHRGLFSQGRGGAQMFAQDVDGDGDQDILSAVDAHGWGLAWYEQLGGESESESGSTFKEHLIMGNRSEIDRFGVAFTQPHALASADINGDGLPDLITGKRRWAHGPDGDIEPGAPPVVYWFELRRQNDGTVRYIPHLIDDESGVGVQILATDLNQDGRIDVATASKLGTFVFLQQ